ncbi:MAG: hypothetical protein IJZ30_06900 [Alphaproteobacteria bacterium]|nr:hypothetical protein [Alphaproteobacteria bacterium]
MDTKKFYYVIVAIVLLLAIFGSWRFLFGFVVAGAIFWYFGEEKVKKAVNDVYKKTQSITRDIQDKVVPNGETIEVAISKSTIFPTNINGLYQIVIVAGNKSYLLKPFNITMLPEEFATGKTIKIITAYKRNGLEVEKIQTIEANGTSYEIVG